MNEFSKQNLEKILEDVLPRIRNSISRQMNGQEDKLMKK